MSSKSRKKPLVRTVVVHTDDSLVGTLEQAREALAGAGERADAAYTRRLQLAAQPTRPAEDLLKVEDGLTQERESSLAPFRAAVDEAETAVRAGAEYFVFRSIGHRRYEDMLAEHAPEEIDHVRVRKATGNPEALANWHEETFEPALVAAACIGNAVTEDEAEELAKNPPSRDFTPVLSVEEATELRDEWTDLEWDQLVQAAFVVARGMRQVDLGKSSRAASARG